MNTDANNYPDLNSIVTQLYHTPSDINEHIPVILKYGNECDHITEMGVRAIVSTWAWLYCAPKKLVAYDIHNPSYFGASLEPLIDMAKKYNLNFEFRQEDVLKIEIEETDLLFIDTWHTYDQLKKELNLHSNKVRKYICFHDTVSYRFFDERLATRYFNLNRQENTGIGIWPAIEEFLEKNKKTWKLKEHFSNNNGFTIIQRINENNISSQ